MQTWRECEAGRASHGGMQDRIAKRRRAYAAEITRRADVRDPRIEKAFAAVPREDFAGPPPWHIGAGGLYGRTSDDDPARLYDDVLVAIDARRGINNGQPSLHALSIDALGVKDGETVLHIGAGAGYYTAILAHLVGPTGRVVAYEIEPDIAERARANLAGFPQVELRARSGVDEALPKAGCIYVNAAASHPVRAWLDALKVGGRLLFPLQAAHSTGNMLLITRPEQGDAWPARFYAGWCSSPAKAARTRRSAVGSTRRSAAAARGACARCVSAPRGRGLPGCKATAGRSRPRRRISRLFHCNLRSRWLRKVPFLIVVWSTRLSGRPAMADLARAADVGHRRRGCSRREGSRERLVTTAGPFLSLPPAPARSVGGRLAPKQILITRQRQPVLASGKASGWSSAQRMRGGGSWF